MSPLPIENSLPELRTALESSTSAVLVAPPGAGKTTRVPLALLREAWLGGRRIVMLEPRRLAARAAAYRMADTLGERVGETVGYRVRMDTIVGPRTRVEVVTEGVLTRMLHDDPTLDGVGLVIFDEFHERSLHADVGLALTLETRSLLRDDLRLLVMSATLAAEPVAALLGGAPVVRSEGRSFPVETRYLASHRAGGPTRVEGRVAAAVRRALRDEQGSVLAFLPGAGEIGQTQRLLEESKLPPDVEVVALFGQLSRDDQDRAIRPSAPGRRKVVLSTSIAQTSLTIDGVRVVVDGGLARVPRFSPRTGMTRLETVRVSRAAADQRRGRAGRLGPGVCYRLWPEEEDHHLVAHDTPEILEADLAPVALDLAAAGVDDPRSLRWLDPPPHAAFNQARELLGELGALDSVRRITAHGRRMATLTVHPRLAHMLIAGDALGAGDLACDLAALLSERDVLRGGGVERPDADVRTRLTVIRDPREGRRTSTTQPGPRLGVDEHAVRRARDEAQRWRQRLGIPTGRATGNPAELELGGILLAFAYPDRIGQRRTGGGCRFVLRNGSGAAFTSAQPLCESSYIVVADMDGQRPDGRIYTAAPLTLAEIEEHFAEQIAHEEVVEWDAAARAVITRARQRLGALTLREGALRDPAPDLLAHAFMDGVRREGVSALPWSEGAARLRLRLAFLHAHDPAWPDVSDAAIAMALEAWLAPRVGGMRRFDDLSRLDLATLLYEVIGWERRARVDELAPTHVTVPSGSRIPIDYSDALTPVLAVRVQEMFGSTDTPRIAGGAVPLTLHLLSPAHRPVQVTRDLAGFWRTSYFEVRKDLRGRYPKHQWPDDPARAEPRKKR